MRLALKGFNTVVCGKAQFGGDECGTHAFPENFRNRKLRKTTVFYAVNTITFTTISFIMLFAHSYPHLITKKNDLSSNFFAPAFLIAEIYFKNRSP